MSKSKGPWDVRAAEVLAGRLKLDAAGLIALVNEVNPTGRGRDAREVAARYARKAELESLLIERFEGSIEVHPDPDDEGVVSLRHRLHQDAACHAKIDALDDAARSWIRRQLDLRERDDAATSTPTSRAPSSRVSSPEIDEDDPDALLGAAETAEAEFDYETAERFYRAAVLVRPDAKSAEAVLRFLVDVLAADGDALGLEASFPSVVRATPPVRVMLALAAARTGDEPRAAKLVAAIEAPRAAEVRILLARAALGRGDAERAGARLAEAARTDPGHPDLRALGEELAKLRGDQRAPLEKELEDLLARGRSDEALAKAEAILARWPESEVARKAARALEAHRLRDEATRAIDEAQALVARDDLGSARALLRRALSSGAALDEALLAKGSRALEAVDATLRERATQEAARRVLAMLEAPTDRSLALAALFDLEDASRALVIAKRAGDPAVHWIQALRSGDARAARSGRVAADAVLALEAAAREVSHNPAHALATLAPHARVLETLPDARALETEARTRIASERQAHALLDLDRAEGALASGELETALALLERSRKELPRDAAARGASLLERITSATTRRELPKRFEQLLAARRYEDAERTLGELAVLDPAAFADRSTTFREEVRAGLRLSVIDLDPSAARAAPALRFGNAPHQYPIEVVACVDLATSTIVLPNAPARHVWLRSYDLATGALVRAIEVRVADAMYEPKAWISGDRIACFGTCMMLELDRTTGRALRFTDFRDPKRPDYRVSDVHELVPRARYLWITMTDPMSAGEVIDREGERRPREIPGLDHVHRLVGRTPPCVAVVRADSALSLHEIGGNQTARYDFKEWVRGVAQDPRGDRLIVLCDPPMVPSPPTELSFIEVFPNGTRGASGVLPEARRHRDVPTATARDAGVTVILYGDVDEPKQRAWLVGMGAKKDDARSPIEVLYRLPISDRWSLAQDPDGRRVFLFAESDEGLRIVELGREPPVIEDLPPRVAVPVPTTGSYACTAIDTSASVQVYADQFKWIPDDEVPARALEIESGLGDLAGKKELLVLFGGVAITEATDVARGMAARIRARFPDDEDTEQVTWTALVVERRWADLRALLEPLDVSARSEPIRKHHHHLLALACFAANDLERGHEHTAAANALQGKCMLTALTSLSEALGAGDLPACSGAGILRALIGATREADELLAKGDAGATIDLLETRLVFEHRDAQSLARLATAHLALVRAGEDGDAGRALSRRFALGTFIDSLSDARVGFTTEIVVPGATWHLDRLVALKREALAFLHADWK